MIIPRTSRLLGACAALACIAAFGPAARAAAPATPPFRLGLNGVFIGGTQSTEQQLAAFKEVGATGLRHLEPNDVGWSAVQSTSGLFTFTNADSVLGRSQDFGFLPTFFGNASLNYYVPPGTPSTNAWSAAAYGTQTTTYLQTVVNRYKATNKYWEIANEMNTKTTSPAGFSAADYAAFLTYCRTAIRAADPQAQVVIAGLLGNYGYPMANAYQWLRDVLAAGGGAGFDVFNYHDYKSWWTLPTHYDQYRSILDSAGLQATPIWVTECAQASAISNANVNPAYASIDGQAADVWRRPCLLWGKGAQTVFWHSYWANPNDTSGFREMGLVNSSTGIRKKSWHAFKLLSQKIEGFATATLVATGTATDDNTSGGNGAWIVRFDFANGTQRWVAWSPDNQSATLTGLTSVASVNLTTVVPATISADGTTVTWTTATRTVSAGTLALTLADTPVLIEVAASVVPAATAPTIASAPAAQTATTGSAVTFSVTAAGTAPFSYQWKKDGAAISGATGASYTITSVSASSAGSYAVTITNSAGSVTSTAAALTVNPSAYLSNLSVRSTLGNGQILTVGLVVSGGAKSMLVRAAGPALVPLGVTTAMTDPRLELFQGETKVAENNDWTASLASTFASLGAFSFPTGSRDAALQQTLSGASTVQASGTGAGTVLVESYDAGSGSAVRLVNLSARNRVGTGGDILIAGFNVAGTGTLRLLVRAIGPTLASFGVSGPLADPKLEVFDANAAKIDENDDWNASLATTFSSVGAFALPAGSKDSAVLLTLAAGRSYTLQVSGINGGTGEGLVEIYEVP